MFNQQNLIPTNQRSESEVRELGRLGGVKSGEARRRKKSLKEITLVMLDNPADEKAQQELLKLYPELEATDLTIGTRLIASLLGKALEGDTTAFQVLRDTSGQKPNEKVEQTVYQTSSLPDDELIRQAEIIVNELKGN